jgi:stage III sporulation protein SpoIIIAA
MTKRVSKFSNENRAGIERTLHRISCIRNRQFLINGFTCRVGRAVFGTISVIRDLLESEKSILILGKPGVGKTTIIREIARVLADEMEKRVIIIDTSNEIAGDSDIPHSGIGRARRMQVAKTELQHQVMIEAVENHMPQVIIIDEIGTELEVLAARTIAEKGVQLVGTTHGNCLENLIKNPPLADLIGGIQYVTLSDDEAKRRRTQKSILERKAYPAFEIIVEINHQTSWTIHEDVKNSVDLFLRGNFTISQVRHFSLTDKQRKLREKVMINSKRCQIHHNSLMKLTSKKNWVFVNQVKSEKSLRLINHGETEAKRRLQYTVRSDDRSRHAFNRRKLRFHNFGKSKSLVIYPYSLSNNLLKEVLFQMGFKFVLTNEIRKANLIIGFKKHLKQNFKLINLAKQKNIPVYSLNQISFYQMTKLLQKLAPSERSE